LDGPDDAKRSDQHKARQGKLVIVIGFISHMQGGGVILMISPIFDL